MLKRENICKQEVNENSSRGVLESVDKQYCNV